MRGSALEILVIIDHSDSRDGDQKKLRFVIVAKMPTDFPLVRRIESLLLLRAIRATRSIRHMSIVDYSRL